MGERAGNLGIQRKTAPRSIQIETSRTEVRSLYPKTWDTILENRHRTDALQLIFRNFFSYKIAIVKIHQSWTQKFCVLENSFKDFVLKISVCSTFNTAMEHAQRIN